MTTATPRKKKLLRDRLLQAAPPAWRKLLSPLSRYNAALYRSSGLDQAPAKVRRSLRNAALPHFLRLGPTMEIDAAIVDSRAAKIRASAMPPSYTILTICENAQHMLSRCALRVAELMATRQRLGGDAPLEWIIICADPKTDEPALRSLLPESIRPWTRLIIEPGGAVSARLNSGVDQARNEWILLLDEASQVSPNAAQKLDRWIAANPDCRCFIPMKDHSFGLWPLSALERAEAPSRFYTRGPIFGGLAAIRRDLWRDLSGFHEIDGNAVIFEFLLRAALHEKTRSAPDALALSDQPYERDLLLSRARAADYARKSAARDFVDARWPRPAPKAVSPPLHGLGLCLVRTQAKRLDLLGEALDSIASQTLPLEACVIVHGDSVTHRAVAEWLEKSESSAHLLHAPDTQRKRGYPLNVGLQYASQHASKYAFVSVLDDDDIYYPTFSERLGQTLAMTGADVVYANTNKRTPGQAAAPGPPLLPASCLVGGNFIPTNACIFRLSTLAAGAGLRFREDIHYLEDWDFLLLLLAEGARFCALPETHSEFRLYGDGNTAPNDPTDFDRCNALVTVRRDLAVRRLGPGAFYRDILEFAFLTNPLENIHEDTMRRARLHYAALDQEGRAAQ